MTENQLNMLEPLTVMNLMQNYTKLRVSRIFLIYDHFIIIHIILVPVEMCQIVFMLDTNIAPYQNRSGYIYCASTSVTILQLCPSGTEMTFQVGGCVNKTSKTEKKIRFEVLCVVLANTTVFPAGSRCVSQPCQNGGLCYDFFISGRLLLSLFSSIYWSSLSSMVPMCEPYTSDKNQLFVPNCN